MTNDPSNDGGGDGGNRSNPRRFDWSRVDWKYVAYRGKSVFAVVLALAVLVGGGLFAYVKVTNAWNDYRTKDDYIGDGDKNVVITVPRGATTYQIADILVAADIIRQAKTFDQVAAQEPKSASIQPGRYQMKTKLPAQTALEWLLDPKRRLYLQVTVPEGLRATRVLDLLSQAVPKGTGIARDEFDKIVNDPGKLGLPAYANGNVEGFLFPDTYQFDENGSALDVLKRMTDQYNAVAKALNLEEGAKAINRDPRAVVIVASIIEKEVFRAEDRPKVARVLYNRLDKNMKLQLDSTVYYAVNKDSNNHITQEDLKVNSPYNTYVVDGLPAGPISNPSRSSLQAALQPAEGGWLYFTTVNFDTGETRFENTQEEHDQNVKVWQQWCKDNPGKCG